MSEPAISANSLGAAVDAEKLFVPQPSPISDKVESQGHLSDDAKSSEKPDDVYPLKKTDESEEKEKKGGIGDYFVSELGSVSSIQLTASLNTSAYSNTQIDWIVYCTRSRFRAV